MKKPKKEEDKPDNLEIVSVGSLYKGQWDKKYWSCSRGKDRYPYPVGYEAIRIYNANTYKMEIREGLKGPVFMITSADGQSCSGQTADIAWKKFQKQDLPRVKLLHGKRFSCKIDGVEFFGFRNSFVQRLLRELVVSVDGTATRLTSSLFSGPSGAENMQCSDPCRYPDLLPYLARTRVTGKRSRKHGKINMGSLSGVDLKTSRPQDLIFSDEDMISRLGDHRNNINRCIKTSNFSKEENNICSNPGALPVSLKLETTTLEENGSFTSHVGLLSKNCLEGSSLDRSQDSEMPGFSFSLATGADVEEVRIPKDASGVNIVDCCVPDTLDLHDSTSDHTPTVPKENCCHAEDTMISSHMVIAVESSPESHLEELRTSTSDPNSEKSDFDSIGQEIAKSMMTVLLPQALPLLQKASKKKKASPNHSKISSSTLKFQEESSGTGRFLDVLSPADIPAESSHEETDGKVHILSGDSRSVIPIIEHLDSVIPDSFENDQCVQHVINRIHSGFVEADHTADRVIHIPHTMGLLGGDHTQKVSLACHVHTSGSKDIVRPNALSSLNEMSQNSDIAVSVSDLAHTFSRKKALPSKSKDVSTKLNENSTSLEYQSEEKECRIAPDCIEDASLMGKVNSPPLPQREISFEKGDPESGKIFTGMSDVGPSKRNYHGPLSESIICRNFGDGCASETDPAKGTLLASEIDQISSSSNSANEKNSAGVEAKLNEKVYSLNSDITTLNPGRVFCDMDLVTSPENPLLCASEDKNAIKSTSPLVAQIENCHSSGKDLLRQPNPPLQLHSSERFQEQGKMLCETTICDAEEVQAGSDSKPPMIQEINDEQGHFFELVGCYMHPMPILSALLRIKENEIYICVLCGSLLNEERTLFMYKIPIKEQRVGCPSFIGHATIILPFSKGTFSRQVALDRSGLQFTPDGQCLILLNSIKAPYCREGKLDCSCSSCTSDCSEENGIKIVQVRLGYVFLVAKLKTVDSVQSILVCEPNHLVAVEEGGKMHLWVMNSAWSALIEEFVIPMYDCISPCIVELKKIPKCAHLVIGHNGLGEFGLWDIYKRLLISRFSAPRKSVFQILPISLFNWERKDPCFSNPGADDHINKIMEATKVSLSEHSENYNFFPSKEHDLAIWLLISTVPDSESEEGFVSNCQTNLVGCWRLALLVENVVILGSTLDPRVTAIDASAGHGIIATHDGLVYMWELSTGNKLGTLHHFKDGGVTCIATDSSRSGVLAVAGDGGQLMVYLHHQRESANHERGMQAT